MIQRVQSLLYLLSAILLILNCLVPIVNIYHGSELIPITMLELAAIKSGAFPVFMIVAIVSFLTALGFLYVIFQYRNRKRQLRVGYILGFLVFALFILQMIFLGKNEFTGSTQNPDYLLAYAFTPLAAFMVGLANRFVKRDEELVRAADRLR